MRVSAAQRGFITVDDLNTIEDYMSDLNLTKRQLMIGAETLARVLAHINLGIAQSMSGGPVDPRRQNDRAAWKIPVRRITGAYYAGWVVKRERVGTWTLRNDSREAVPIEYGLTSNSNPNAVRRPIQKLSLLQTLKKAEASAVWHRIFLISYGPLIKGHATSRPNLPMFGGPG